MEKVGGFAPHVLPIGFAGQFSSQKSGCGALPLTSAEGEAATDVAVIHVAVIFEFVGRPLVAPLWLG